MRLSDFIAGMTREQQDEYAVRCGTTGIYLRTHIVPARKECRKELREAMAEQSGGAVSLLEVLDHFGMLPEGFDATQAA